ncbi:MAG: hypothetical protein QXN16_04080 [Candidatus Micrarchaeaceae archaeon]
MILTFSDQIVILIMVFFSVMELFRSEDRIHRFRALIGTFISSFFLIILQGLKIFPGATLSSVLIAGLGVLFGVVYFSEGLTFWWGPLLIKRLKKLKNENKAKK